MTKLATWTTLILLLTFFWYNDERRCKVDDRPFFFGCVFYETISETGEKP